MHNSTTFQDLHTVLKKHLIGPGEWIWADSTYLIEAWCITPFKKPAVNALDNKDFNYWVSHVKGLHQQIKNALDHEHALTWIWTCIIIHTMIHEIETESFNEEWNEELILDGLSLDELSLPDKDHIAAQICCKSQGQHMRRKVKEDLFANGPVDYHDDSKYNNKNDTIYATSSPGFHELEKLKLLAEKSNSE
jgi:hypothetical protein